MKKKNSKKTTHLDRLWSQWNTIAKLITSLDESPATAKKRMKLLNHIDDAVEKFSNLITPALGLQGCKCGHPFEDHAGLDNCYFNYKIDQWGALPGCDCTHYRPSTPKVTT